HRGNFHLLANTIECNHGSKKHKDRFARVAPRRLWIQHGFKPLRSVVAEKPDGAANKRSQSGPLGEPFIPKMIAEKINGLLVNDFRLIANFYHGLRAPRARNQPWITSQKRESRQTFSAFDRLKEE